MLSVPIYPMIDFEINMCCSFTEMETEKILLIKIRKRQLKVVGEKFTPTEQEERQERQRKSANNLRKKIV